MISSDLWYSRKPLSSVRFFFGLAGGGPRFRVKLRTGKKEEIEKENTCGLGSEVGMDTDLGNVFFLSSFERFFFKLNRKSVMFL